MLSKKSFFNIAKQGRTGWLRYLFGTVAIIGISMICMIISMNIIAYISNVSIKNINLLVYGDPIRTLLIYGIYCGSFFIGIYFITEKLHNRKFRTLFSPESSIDWFRIIKGFTLWLGLVVVSWMPDYLIYPSHYQLIFNFEQ